MWNDDTAGSTVHQPMAHEEGNLTLRNPGVRQSQAAGDLLKSPSKELTYPTWEKRKKHP